MVQGVHGVDLADEVVQGFWLTQHICLQTLHSYVKLVGEARKRVQPQEFLRLLTDDCNSQRSTQAFILTRVQHKRPQGRSGSF